MLIYDWQLKEMLLNHKWLQNVTDEQIRKIWDLNQSFKNEPFIYYTLDIAGNSDDEIDIGERIDAWEEETSHIKTMSRVIYVLSDNADSYVEVLKAVTACRQEYVQMHLDL